VRHEVRGDGCGHASGQAGPAAEAAGPRCHRDGQASLSSSAAAAGSPAAVSCVRENDYLIAVDRTDISSGARDPGGAARDDPTARWGPRAGDPGRGGATGRRADSAERLLPGPHRRFVDAAAGVCAELRGGDTRRGARAGGGGAGDAEGSRRDTLTSVGLSCAFCHSTVDSSFCGPAWQGRVWRPVQLSRDASYGAPLQASTSCRRRGTSHPARRTTPVSSH
jgi:hypothetical protein